MVTDFQSLTQLTTESTAGDWSETAGSSDSRETNKSQNKHGQLAAGIFYKLKKTFCTERPVRPDLGLYGHPVHKSAYTWVSI